MVSKMKKNLHTSLATKLRCVKSPLPIYYSGPTMKLFILMVFVVSTAFANEGEMLLNCTRTSFTDLDQIQITANINKSDEVIVTEIDENGNKNVYGRDASSMKMMEIELSDWYGYTRRLFNDGSGWTIEHRDECSGGYSYVVCQ